MILRRVQLETARTPAERARGLMFRPSLPEDHGMLFVFDADTRGSFTNENTFVPLTIAFLASDGRIVDLVDTHAFRAGERAERYEPRSPYRYALEMNRGWFQRAGFRVGDILRVLPRSGPNAV